MIIEETPISINKVQVANIILESGYVLTDKHVKKAMMELIEKIKHANFGENNQAQ